MQDAPKAVWSIQYVSLAFFPSLKQNFIAYRSSKVSSRPDCIFEIHQLWQSGWSRVYSNSCCSRSFEPEIIKSGQSSHKMYDNNILNFQESTTILNASTKKSGKLLNVLCIYIYIYMVIIIVIIIVKSGQRHLTDGNQDKVRTPGEKETYKYLGILEDDSIKQVEVKKIKIKKSIFGEPESYLRQNSIAETLSKK